MRDTRETLGHGPAEEDTEFEARLRELLGRQTDGFRAGEAPYASIVRRGRTGRRRRLLAVGAGLAALVAVPGTALAVHYQPDGRSTTALPAQGARPSAAASGVQPRPSESARARGPEGPLTPGQLADGISLQRAGEALDRCLAFEKAHGRTAGVIRGGDLGKAEDYRVILAMNATGDQNSPGDGIRVVAVGTSADKPVRLICTDKDSGTQGLNTSTGDHTDADGGPVFPDSNAYRLYKMDTATGPGLPYRFPFRWGSVGTVEPGVAKVTVSYGGVTRQAALDHGYFVATGVLTRAVTSLPRIKGFDADGELVYDSKQDKGYE